MLLSTSRHLIVCAMWQRCVTRVILYLPEKCEQITHVFSSRHAARVRSPSFAGLRIRDQFIDLSTTLRLNKLTDPSAYLVVWRGACLQPRSPHPPSPSQAGSARRALNGQLRNDQLGTVDAACLKRLRQLGPIVLLSALDLGELRRERPLATVVSPQAHHRPPQAHLACTGRALQRHHCSRGG
jgi:hypothetical protein